MELCQEQAMPAGSPELEVLQKVPSGLPPAVGTVVLGGAPARRKRGSAITRETITSRCRLNPDTGCWEWTRARHKYGYGELRNGKSGVRASRLAYKLWKGEIPDGMEVCHECDNPPCCNPDHLFLGDHTKNMRDAKSKGRLNSKLDQVSADRIRVDTRPYREICSEYAVSAATISEIKSGKRWTQT